MTSRTLLRSVFLASAALLGPKALATDLRLDVATDNNNGSNAFFGPVQLTNLNFRSVNGHDIEQGNASHQSTIQAAGNTLGVYYNNFSSDYTTPQTPPTAANEASAIQSWVKSDFGGSSETGAWLVLNEADGSTWDGSGGNAYRTWLVSILQDLNADGYQKIVLFSPQSLASNTYSSTWKSIAQYAYIGAEMFIDGQVVVSDNFSVPTLQTQYQSWYDAWTSTSNGAGISASKLLCDEHFSVNTYASSNYWGADGISGGTWQAAIEARDIAIHNIPFGGFIGYAWDKDAQDASAGTAVQAAAQISYERAYASTLVTQTEVPAWTGNDGSGSWADYLNWTGGLPSTTSPPFPLLAASNPNLPKQTTANFFNAPANTVITLDGSQSITQLAFSGAYSYTITPGTGGSLTMTGAGASISVSGSHAIAVPLVLAGSTGVTVTHAADALTISGPVSGGGGLSLNGAGALKLTASDSYNGVTTINGGLLTAGTAGALSANSAITINGGTLDTSGFANTVAALTMTGSGWMNLGLGKTLTSTGAAALSGTLNVAGTATLGNYRLLTYSSRTGTFAATTGIGSSYGLYYNTNGTELDELHKAQVGTLTVTAASPKVITGGTMNLTAEVVNSAPANSDSLNFTTAASGMGFGSSATGSLAPAGSGNFTLAAGFNSASLLPGRYTGTVTVTGTNGALGGQAVSSGSSQAVTITVLDHAAAAFADGGGTLDLSFGTVQRGSGAQSLQFAIENLPAAYRAGLDLDSVSKVSDPAGVFSTDAVSFADLVPGYTSNPFDLFLNASQTGQFSGTFQFNLSDEKDLSGHAGQQTLTLDVTADVVAVHGLWTTNGGGNWSGTANWSGGSVPGSPQDTAVFAASLGGGSAAVNMDVPVTLAGLAFSTTGGDSYVISSSSGMTMTLANTAGAAAIDNSGSNAITAALTLASSLSLNVAAGSELTITANISESGGSQSLALAGGGTLVLSGSSGYSGGTFVESGTLIAANSRAIADGTSLYVGSVSSAFGSAVPAAAPTTPVPEPGTLALVAVSAAGLLAHAWRRQKTL